jgi:hypothetical protein
MRPLIRFLLLCLLPMAGWAQSSLPQCSRFTTAAWNNCFGTMNLPNGNKYVGEFRNGNFFGKGTYTWVDGSKYTGEWKNDRAHGQGTWNYSNGEIYIGEFRDDERDGQGSWSHPNGERYSGGFKRDRREGRGVYTWPDGSSYAGEFKGDKRNGVGTFFFLNGEKYVGEYRDDERNGQGVRYAPNGTIIEEGRWENSRLAQSFAVDTKRFPFYAQAPSVAPVDGRPSSALPQCPTDTSLRWHDCFGNLTVRNLGKYVGVFRDGKLYGPGSWVHPSGAQYVGEFSDSLRTGQGIRYASDGTIVQQGIWEKDSLVRSSVVDVVRFPFDPKVVPASATSAPLMAERDRLAAEADVERKRVIEFEKKLAAEASERSRLAAEVEEARRQHQQLQDRLTQEARERERLVAEVRERDRLAAETAEARRQQELAQEAREKERLTVEARDRLAAEARERERQAAQVQQELEQRLATEARERERQTVEAEAARRKQQELERQLAAQAEEARRQQQQLQERLAQEAKERERVAAEAAERSRASAEAEAEAARRRLQELEARLAALQPQSASRPSSQAAAIRNQRRVALVIGNAQYKVSPLENPVNDATDVDQTLRQLGFQTTLVRNATLGQMREATRRFADQLGAADVALIYFAGHGIESNRKNYMIPVNADLKFEYELADQAYDAGNWLEMLESIKSSNAERVNIVILDACRNNSLIGARSLGRGLGRMDAPTGTFLAYSTAPGKVAADGARGQRNSPFTRHLLSVMQQPGLPIEEAFKEVRRNVSRETNGAQVPWESTSLTGFFTFRQTR